MRQAHSPGGAMAELARCRSTGSTEAQDDDMEDLEAARRSFQRAIEERDGEAAREVLDPEYALVLIQPERAVVPRTTWLDVLEGYVVHDYVEEATVVDVAGDLAVVLQRVRMHATVHGQDRSGRFVISDVWRRTGDGWRVWRRHSTPLDAGELPLGDDG